MITTNVQMNTKLQQDFLFKHNQIIILITLDVIMVFHKLNLITGVALSVYISVQLGVGFINASRIK